MSSINSMVGDHFFPTHFDSGVRTPFHVCHTCRVTRINNLLVRHGHCAATQRDLVMAWGKQIVSSQVLVGAFLNPSDVRMITQPSQKPHAFSDVGCTKSTNKIETTINWHKDHLFGSLLERARYQKVHLFGHDVCPKPLRIIQGTQSAREVFFQEPVVLAYETC